MNTITNQQKEDIEMLLNRFYNPQQQADLILSASNNRTSVLKELNIDEAYLLHTHVGYNYSQSRKMQYAIALAFHYDLCSGFIKSPEPTERNIELLSTFSRQLFDKNLSSLELVELDRFIKFVQDVGATVAKYKKERERSAEYYQATKATNQLLKSLSIPKEPAQRKSQKKKP